MSRSQERKQIRTDQDKTKAYLMETKTEMGQWFLVANTPGVDIRHKFNGQELILVENVNYQIANKIIRAINSHEALLVAAKNAQNVLAGLAMGHLKEVRADSVALKQLREAVAKAEGK